MFSITTPIFYVNDEPHLGHAYTTILADVLARYHRLQGEETFFLTGLDEHGQKVQNALKKQGVASPSLEAQQAYVDGMAQRFLSTWERLDIAYDDFLRTTQPRHARVVQQTLQQLWDAGQIYRGEYEGWYCVPDERYWTEKDLVDGNCPDCGRPVERLAEGNYFFRMSQYQDWLIDYIETHPSFIQPAFRRNEVLGFLRRPLGDLCISRPAARLNWGIPLPFDPAYVTYVWFDALLNYVTAAGYLSDPQRFERVWPETMHLIGKDILTTHSVYWPTMLKAMGLPLPKMIFAHGYWVIGGMKMSKSRGNAVRPLDLAEIYGPDAFRYFLLRDMTLGQDADFDEARLAGRYNTDLANNLGNLLQRVTSMVGRTCGGVAPAPGEPGEEERALRQLAEALPGQVFARVEALEINTAIQQVMDASTAVNGYLERSAPWREAKAGRRERVETSLYAAGEALRLASVLLAPLLPERIAELWRRLGWQPTAPLLKALSWGCWQPGSRVEQGEPLFPKKVLSEEGVVSSGE